MRDLKAFSSLIFKPVAYIDCIGLVAEKLGQVANLKIICSIRMLSCQAQLIHYLLRLGITHCITCKVAQQVMRLAPENMDTKAASFATVHCTLYNWHRLQITQARISNK